MQLCRAPEEHPDPQFWNLYSRLLGPIQLPVLRGGRWQLLECLPAWQSNWTWDGFVAFSWSDNVHGRLLVVVNYSPHQGQCYVRLPWDELSGVQITFKGQLDEADYVRSGDDLDQFGLYMDMPAWEAHVFMVEIE